jgi:isopentenyl diphosphate isomerase/L-lactate dehydrogenase-like FMN-dependent dehydrogenase
MTPPPSWSDVGWLRDEWGGGIRRRSDVVKALALGARAVLIGRAYLWGMAVNGEAGVANVLEIIRAGIDETLLGLGRASIRDRVPDDVLVPPSFAPAALASARQ